MSAEPVIDSEDGTALSEDELRDAWPALATEERVDGFRMLPAEEADDFFLTLMPLGQAQIITGLPRGQRRIWMRLLAPDDAADVVGGESGGGIHSTTRNAISFEIVSQTALMMALICSLRTRLSITWQMTS